MADNPAAASPTLTQQAYIDSAAILDSFGADGIATTPEQVQAAHVIWASVPEGERHIVSLLFHQFDAQPDLFSGAPEPVFTRELPS